MYQYVILLNESRLQILYHPFKLFRLYQEFFLLDNSSVVVRVVSN